MTIIETFETKHAKSAAVAKEAREYFPDGVTHDGRRIAPFPIYIDRAAGSHKWDIDGNEYIDFVSGHGSLLLGHCYPAVVEAVEKQIRRGTHYGGSSLEEIEWGKWVTKLIPSAERVRFTSSGTEAVMMAVRLARAYTGKPYLIKFENHFHGWSDTVSANVAGAERGPVGIPAEALKPQIILPVNDPAALAKAVADYRGQIGVAIIEPTGCSMGQVPVEPEFLQELRRVTEQEGIVLIFDEVVTGFRCSPGGAQGYYGVIPDMSTMAKILAGGLPGGAVGGRADIMDEMSSTNPDGTVRSVRVSHPGTFNANPISAAAGAAALPVIATGEPHEKANASARRLASEMNAIIRRHEVPGGVYGHTSIIHIVLGEEIAPPSNDFDYTWANGEKRSVPRTAPAVASAFRRAMINEGVDVMSPKLIVGSEHSPEDVEATLAAFDRVLSAMQDEGVL